MNFNNNYNGESREPYRPTVYGSYSYTNMDSSVDVSRLSYSYWKGLLKIAISTPKTNNVKSDYNEWDTENSVYGYLTPFKARILADGIDKILTKAVSNYGVKIKNGILYITRASEFGGSENSFVLVIKYVDDNGNVLTSAAYEFTCEYHFGITNYNSDNKSFDTDFMEGIFELNMFKQTLLNYANAADYSIAASVCDAMSTSVTGSMYKKLDAIGNKLGVQGNTRYGSSNSSYFNARGNSNASSEVSKSGESTEYDDIESMLSDME